MRQEETNPQFGDGCFSRPPRLAPSRQNVTEKAGQSKARSRPPQPMGAFERAAGAVGPRGEPGARARRRRLWLRPLSLRWRRGRLSPSPPPCPRPAGLALFPFSSNGGDGGAGAAAVLPSPGQPAQPRQCGPQAGRGNGSASPRTLGAEPACQTSRTLPERGGGVVVRVREGREEAAELGRAPRVSSGTQLLPGRPGPSSPPSTSRRRPSVGGRWGPLSPVRRGG